uniref:Uncharacterized protein n=1 Tax=Parascaris univalens TaxID=6257 RepID=A0A915C971_PARUN
TRASVGDSPPFVMTTFRRASPGIISQVERRRRNHAICPSTIGCVCETHFGFLLGIHEPFTHVAFGEPRRMFPFRHWNAIDLPSSTSVI